MGLSKRTPASFKRPGLTALAREVIGAENALSMGSMKALATVSQQSKHPSSDRSISRGTTGRKLAFLLLLLMQTAPHAMAENKSRRSSSPTNQLSLFDESPGEAYGAGGQNSPCNAYLTRRDFKTLAPMTYEEFRGTFRSLDPQSSAWFRDQDLLELALKTSAVTLRKILNFTPFDESQSVESKLEGIRAQTDALERILNRTTTTTVSRELFPGEAEFRGGAINHLRFTLIQIRRLVSPTADLFGELPQAGLSRENLQNANLRGIFFNGLFLTSLKFLALGNTPVSAIHRRFATSPINQDAKSVLRQLGVAINFSAQP